MFKNQFKNPYHSQKQKAMSQMVKNIKNYNVKQVISLVKWILPLKTYSCTKIHVPPKALSFPASGLSESQNETTI